MTTVRDNPTGSLESSRSIDVERLILVPILTGLLTLNVGTTISYISSIERLDGVEALDVVYKALVVVFYVFLIVLLLVRRPAKDAGRDWLGIVMAYSGTFGPMLLLGLGGVGEAGPFQKLVSVILMTTGMTFAIYSVAYLGRSFGAVPRARALVTSGPYSRIRHPLYVGEMVAFIGAILIDVSPYKVAVLLLLVFLQGYRAILEERVLSGAFPEYMAYRGRTERFIPGLI
jgi:protein-S-isoprenylcysteine O-methyltransferase Ste14